MIVVHPYSNSTSFLRLAYEDLTGARFFSYPRERENLLEALRCIPREECILILGKGTPYGPEGGLLYDSDAHLLRDRPNLICIWNLSSTFAVRHGLKGLFSGSFIWDPGEAFCDGLVDNLEEKKWDFAGRLGELLRGGVSVPKIAEILTADGYQDNDLTHYNYSRLTLRVRGDEPLPEKEDYWGYDETLLMDNSADSRLLTDEEVLERGLSEIRAEWQNYFMEDMIAGIDPEVLDSSYQMSEVCLTVLMEDYAKKAAEYCPGARKMAEAVSKALRERALVKRVSKGFNPAYIIHLSGHDYALWQQGEKRDTFISWSTGDTVEPIRIGVGPGTFANLLGRFHYGILPKIDVELERYRKLLLGRVMIGRIRQEVTRSARINPDRL